ncbi:sigma factor-like helix-turn-helix DNA-binding protein [Neobacillus sp. FSL H8-0543]|uniref:sigma factor-like helix-turn-helix DNA-binding protein n=1 Tax=Neobacillus sp. FSL H8-0543 TaxID=2954672 RepID=UPI0031581AE5
MPTEFNSSSFEYCKQKKVKDDPFWIEYFPKLQRYCHFLTQNKWDGDDIAQEAFLKATSYYHRNKLNAALINKIAYNHWMDTLRKRRNETLEGDPQFKADNQLDMIPETIDVLLRQFTPKQAVIFFLKEGFQYQTKEIADMLRTTEMAVKSNLHRAKKRLEKEKHNDQLTSVEIFWDEEERVQLEELFYESFKKQDPSILIQSIPSIKSVADVPQLIGGNIQPLQFYTPTGTLCMAA